MTTETTERYVPPEQSGRGQLRDGLLIIGFVFIILFGSTYALNAGSPTPPVHHKSLEQLPLTSAERAQYRKLIAAHDVTLEEVNQMVESQQADPHKYDLNAPLLIGIFVFIALYLFYVFGMSFRQYKDVIREKFGTGQDGGS